MASPAWTAWLHPIRTAKALAEAISRADELSARHDIISKRNEQLIQESEQTCSKLKETETKLFNISIEITVLDSRNRELLKQLELQKKEIARLSTDLDARLETEQQIRQFEEKLNSIEALKARYEKKISTLMSTIASLKESIAEQAHTNELSIDMSEIQNRKKKSAAQDSDDWLEILNDR